MFQVQRTVAFCRVAGQHLYAMTGLERSVPFGFVNGYDRFASLHAVPRRSRAPASDPTAAIRKRGARKLVIAPDSTTERPRPRTSNALVKALARAPMAAHPGERGVRQHH